MLKFLLYTLISLRSPGIHFETLFQRVHLYFALELALNYPASRPWPLITRAGVNEIEDEFRISYVLESKGVARE